MSILTTIHEKTIPDVPTWSTNNLTFDNNGNLLTYNYGAESSVQYDYENRPTNLVAAALTNQYSYDGLGDRTLRTINGRQHRDVLDRSADLHNVLMTTDSEGNPLRYYIWGRGLIAQIETNGTVYYYHPDIRGSTLAMTDSSGSTVAEYAYSPYGQIMNHTGLDTAYNWIGTYGVWNEGAGMFHMKARYFNSMLRRFVTTDPIGINGGFNFYTYANANPVFFIDPLGLFWGDIAVGVSLAADGMMNTANQQMAAPGVTYIYYREVHYSRNQRNTIVTLQEAQDQNWPEMSAKKSIYHRMGPGNEKNMKFVSPNGKSEAVFKPGGAVVIDSANMATYNFSSPNKLFGLGHLAVDVLPYYAWGNSPDDPTTFLERLTASYEGEKVSPCQ